MASKVTFISGQTIEVPGHGWLKRGIEIVRECDEEILESPELFDKFTAHYYEVADLTVQAALWRWVAAHPTPAPVGPLVRDRDDPARKQTTYQNGDGAKAIEDARQRAEPVAATNGNGNGHGYQKQTVEWNRGGGSQPSSGQYNRGGGGGKSYGPPTTGGQLIAWAKGLEEKGEASGLVKWIMYVWPKSHGLGSTMVKEWPAEAVTDCYNEALKRQETGS